MDTSDYIVFRKFTQQDRAKHIASLLEKNNIKTFIEKNSLSTDSTFGAGANNELEIKIPKTDFEKALKVLEQEAKEELKDVDKDYYLFDFTNEELYEILLKPDEWNEFDVLLSKQILAERGANIDEQLIQSLKKQRLEDLSKPEDRQTIWVIFGYIAALLGGLLGLFIGWFLWKHKKTLPNGERVYAYSEPDRFHGRNILFIGLLLFIVWGAIYITQKIWS